MKPLIIVKSREDQEEDCPSFEDLDFRPDRQAVKRCNEEGTWWVHPETNR